MIVQNREIFLLFFTHISSPYQYVSMLHKGSRNGIYGLQHKKMNLENSIFPSPIAVFNNAIKGGKMTKHKGSEIRLFVVFLLQ